MIRIKLSKVSSTTEKPDLDNYPNWLSQELNIDCGSRQEHYYSTVVDKIKKDFCNSEFWKTLEANYANYNSKYRVETDYHLFVDNVLPTVVVKPFSSLVEKSYRKNVLYNELWPEPPLGGWIIPDDCFEDINDAVRTCFVVKYLDGVEYFANILAKLAEQTSLAHKLDFEAKEEGYYAAHFYITFPCDIPKKDWDTKDVEVSIEIQITTQLQEVIRRLLHKHYEERRVSRQVANNKWQWEYKSDEFATNYLGHILHYIEGMIMDVRDKDKRRDE